jgi:hypothetical protein
MAAYRNAGIPRRPSIGNGSSAPPIARTASINSPNLPRAQQLIEVSRGFNEGRVVPEEARSAENTTPTSIEEFSEVFAKAYVGEG